MEHEGISIKTERDTAVQFFFFFWLTESNSMWNQFCFSDVLNGLEQGFLSLASEIFHTIL